jgi:hypothetical protein
VERIASSTPFWILDFPFLTHNGGMDEAMFEKRTSNVALRMITLAANPKSKIRNPK